MKQTSGLLRPDIETYTPNKDISFGDVKKKCQGCLLVGDVKEKEMLVGGVRSVNESGCQGGVS